MLTVHEIRPEDVQSIGLLHAASWRAAYRGILLDEFLDGDLVSNRVAFWERRLTDHAAFSGGYLATSNNAPAGFTFAFFNADETWGTLLDNLHVRPDIRRRGVGRVLLRALAMRCIEAAGAAGVFLWFYEQNLPAQRFYDSLGGIRRERQVVEVRGGGTAAEWRYSWPSADALLSAVNDT